MTYLSKIAAIFCLVVFSQKCIITGYRNIRNISVTNTLTDSYLEHFSNLEICFLLYELCYLFCYFVAFGIICFSSLKIRCYEFAKLTIIHSII